MEFQTPTSRIVRFWVIILAAVALTVVIFGISFTYRMQNKDAEATRVAGPTITAESLEAHYQKGLGYINIERWQDARTELELIFEVDPNYKDVQTKLKEVYEKIASLSPPATPLPVNEGTRPLKSNSLEEGLIAYYPFNGNANDESGNNHHGIIHGEPQIIPGVAGQAFRFDGDDHIEVSNSIDFEPGQNDYSVVVWVRYRQNAYGQRVLLIIDEPESFRWVQLADDSDKDELGFGLKSGTNPSQTFIRYSPIKDNQWHLISGIREDIHKVRLYVDGELVNEAYNQNLGDVRTYSNGSIYIGFDPSYERYYNDGDIDELRIYNRALNAEEVKALYALKE